MKLNLKKLFSSSLGARTMAMACSGMVVLSAGLGIGSYQLTKETVVLKVDGEERQIRTHAKTVEELLEEQQIKLHKDDYLYPSKNLKIKHNMKITYEPAKSIEFVLDGVEKDLRTTEDTVSDFLRSNKIHIDKHDLVKPKLNAPIKDHMKVNVEIAFPVHLNVGGKNQHVWSTSTTVADFLEKQHITINQLDRVEPALGEKIEKQSQVKVIRVEKVTDVVEVPVDYAVTSKKDASLPQGEKKVIKAGEKGLVKKHFEVTMENGKVVSKVLLKKETIKNSQDALVAVGTDSSRAQVSRGGMNTVSEFYVRATAYTASCNGCSGTTSTGLNLRANPHLKVIAVDPRIIPLGTKVYVEGYGYAIAADTGGAIKGRKIDVFFPDASSAYRWGAKTVLIKILK